VRYSFVLVLVKKTTIDLTHPLYESCPSKNKMQFVNKLVYHNK